MLDEITVTVKVRTHYPCSGAVFTGRKQGPWTRVSFWTPVLWVENNYNIINNSAFRSQWPCSRCPKMTPVNTGNVYAPLKVSPHGGPGRTYLPYFCQWTFPRMTQVRWLCGNRAGRTGLRFVTSLPNWSFVDLLVLPTIFLSIHGEKRPLPHPSAYLTPSIVHPTF